MTESSSNKNQFLFRIIKMADIAYITVLYFILGYFVGYNIDKLFEFIYGNDFSSHSTPVLIIQVLSQIMVIGIISYLGRNLVQLIPSPLNGINGFVHTRVRELMDGAFLTVFLLMFQYSMTDKLDYIKKKQDLYVKNSESALSSYFTRDSNLQSTPTV